MGKLRQKIETDLNLEAGGRSYGRFPLLKFLFPNRYLREILDIIRSDIAALSNHDVTVVAHSFGAYLIYELLQTNHFPTDPSSHLNRRHYQEKGTLDRLGTFS